MSYAHSKEKKQPLVRMDAADKAILDSLTAETGESAPRLLHKAVTRLKRDLFYEKLNRGYKNIRGDADAWEKEQTEREIYEDSSADGLQGLK